jgi:hypothetical protein
VLICKQDFESGGYIYKSVEILSSTDIYEHAMIISPDQTQLFVNVNNDCLYVEQRDSMTSYYGLMHFDKFTGQIGDKFKTFSRKLPLNFLSPSFIHYIHIESHTHSIYVRDVTTEGIVCKIPTHFIKHLWREFDSFSEESFMTKIFFIDEDLILL